MEKYTISEPQEGVQTAFCESGVDVGFYGGGAGGGKSTGFLLEAVKE